MTKGFTMRRRVATCAALSWVALLTPLVICAGAPTQKQDQPTERKLKARDIRWEEHFGELKAEPDTIYCLMGSGFFRAPTSSNFDTLVKRWLSQHPDAGVTPVSTVGPLMVSRPKSQMTWAWVVDGEANLNEYLVRQGACSGDTMQTGFSSSASTTGDVHQSGLLVAAEIYKRFQQRIAEAEKQAKRQKLGIWRASGRR
jgi:hypothetical protein